MFSTWPRACGRQTSYLTISTSCCAMWSPRVIRGERPRPNSGWYGAIGNRGGRYGVNGPTRGSTKVLGPIVPSGSCWAPWSPGWRCCPLPTLAVGARQFCSVDGVPVRSAAIALHSAPGARRLAIGGALVAAALACKMAGIYAIQAMESAVDAPAGTEAETVVDRLAAQTVRSFRKHHGLMVDDDFA